MNEASVVWVCLKTNQQTTPIASTFSAEETISIIDPRHPLYGQTLRLIQFAKSAHYHGPCCVVWLENGAERLIPLGATDRAPQPPTFYSFPLNLTSAENLARTYARILNQIKERADNVQPTPNQPISEGSASLNKHQQCQASLPTAMQSDSLRAAVEPPHCCDTGSAASPSDQRQSHPHQQSKKRNRQRGGKR